MLADFSTPDDPACTRWPCMHPTHGHFLPISPVELSLPPVPCVIFLWERSPASCSACTRWFILYPMASGDDAEKTIPVRGTELEIPRTDVSFCRRTTGNGEDRGKFFGTLARRRRMQRRRTGGRNSRTRVQTERFRHVQRVSRVGYRAAPSACGLGGVRKMSAPGRRAQARNTLESSSR